MKDAMTKLKQQATDLAARAAADAEEAAQSRAQAEREYNSIAAELEQERQQVRTPHCTADAPCPIGGWHRAPCMHNQIDVDLALQVAMMVTAQTSKLAQEQVFPHTVW
jgi:hypothetical protein